MLKNIFDADSIKEEANKLREELEKETVTYQSGGGMVKITVDGLGKIKDLTIEEEIIDKDEKEMLEDLIVAAFNKSKDRIKELWEEKMQEMFGMLPIPGMKNLFT